MYQHTPIPKNIFQSAINTVAAQRMIDLERQGIITSGDVTDSLGRIRELGF